MFNLEAIVAVMIPNIGGILLSSYMKKCQESKWYKNLILPKFAPPPWLSGLLWISHFTCMGFSSYLVWNKAGFIGGAYPLGLYFANLLFCFAWAPIFFGFQSLKGAYIDGLLNLIAASGTVFEFYKVSPPAGVLMVPYLCWLAYTAIHLNYKIYVINKRKSK